MRFGKHRGFAFVEYVTKQETKNALQALSNTHLYGRHLVCQLRPLETCIYPPNICSKLSDCRSDLQVLERAKEGESLEELRARTAAQYTDGQSSTKLSKKRKHMAVLDEGSLRFERIADQLGGLTLFFLLYIIEKK